MAGLCLENVLISDLEVFIIVIKSRHFKLQNCLIHIIFNDIHETHIWNRHFPLKNYAIRKNLVNFSHDYFYSHLNSICLTSFYVFSYFPESIKFLKSNFLAIYTTTRRTESFSVKFLHVSAPVIFFQQVFNGFGSFVTQRKNVFQFRKYPFQIMFKSNKLSLECGKDARQMLCLIFFGRHLLSIHLLRRDIQLVFFYHLILHPQASLSSLPDGGDCLPRWV